MGTKQAANGNAKPGIGSSGMRNTNTVIYDVVGACEMKDSNGLRFPLKAKDEFRVWLWGDSTYRAESGGIPAVIDRKVLCDLETSGHIQPRDPKNTLVSRAAEPKVADPKKVTAVA